MKRISLPVIFALNFVLFTTVKAQTADSKLPWAYYMTMTNSCTSADIVLLQGDGGSLNVDKPNMGIVKEFINDNPTEEVTGTPAATIMCHINGQEFITGYIFIQDNGGAVKFKVEGKEYSNRLSDKGFEFFRSVIASL
jgi:uncharacterized protein YbcI